MAEVDNQEIFSELDRLESALADNYALAGNVKEALSEALEANAQLALENEKLRQRLQELDTVPTDSSDLANAVEKMRQIYEEGFHVCHQYYGKKLENGESCLLCQEVIYR